MPYVASVLWTGQNSSKAAPDQLTGSVPVCVPPKTHRPRRARPARSPKRQDVWPSSPPPSSGSSGQSPAAWSCFQTSSSGASSRSTTRWPPTWCAPLALPLVPSSIIAAAGSRGSRRFCKARVTHRLLRVHGSAHADAPLPYVRARAPLHGLTISARCCRASRERTGL